MHLRLVGAESEASMMQEIEIIKANTDFIMKAIVEKMVWCNLIMNLKISLVINKRFNPNENYHKE